MHDVPAQITVADNWLARQNSRLTRQTGGWRVELVKWFGSGWEDVDTGEHVAVIYFTCFGIVFWQGSGYGDFWALITGTFLRAGQKGCSPAKMPLETYV